MTTVGAYWLRRQAGSEGFRRAWEAALDFGVARMKDIAFERAIEGYLVPCFVGGKLIGWRRKYNDRLLMFCLRHYGEDANGKRTKIEYFSTRASAGAGAANPPLPQAGEDAKNQARWATGRSGRGEGLSGATAEASTTTVRTIISGKGDVEDAAALLDRSTNSIDSFEAVELDDAARQAILEVLRECAERRRLVEGTPDDPQEHFFAVEQPEREMLIHDSGFPDPRKELRRPPAVAGAPLVEEDALLEPSPRLLVQPDEGFRSSDAEMRWEMLDHEEGMAEIEQAVEAVKRAKLPSPRSAGEGKREGA